MWLNKQRKDKRKETLLPSREERLQQLVDRGLFKWYMHFHSDDDDNSVNPDNGSSIHATSSNPSRLPSSDVTSKNQGHSSSSNTVLDSSVEQHSRKKARVEEHASSNDDVDDVNDVDSYN